MLIWPSSRPSSRSAPVKWPKTETLSWRRLRRFTFNRDARTVSRPLASITKRPRNWRTSPSADVAVTMPPPSAGNATSVTRHSSTACAPLALALSNRILSNSDRRTWNEEFMSLCQPSPNCSKLGVSWSGETNSMPYFGMPMRSTSSLTPSLSNSGMLKGSRDSPIWKRGCLSFSIRVTLLPRAARSAATVDPAGPLPRMTTSRMRAFSSAKDATNPSSRPVFAAPHCAGTGHEFSIIITICPLPDALLGVAMLTRSLAEE